MAAFGRSLDAADPFVVGFNEAILPMAISDPTLPDNPIIHVNAAFERLTGYARDEVVGRNCRFLQGPETYPEDVSRLRDAIGRSERLEIDLLNHRKDGTPFWNRLLVAPVFDRSRHLRYYVASQHDVTLERETLALLEAEQRELEASAAETQVRLADSAARLQFALKAGRLGAWTFDPASQHLDASDGCKIVFGYDPGAAFGYPEFLETIHPEDRPRVVEAIQETIATGCDYDIEYRIVTPTGEVRWVAIRGDRGTSRAAGGRTDAPGQEHARDGQRDRQPDVARCRVHVRGARHDRCADRIAGGRARPVAARRGRGCDDRGYRDRGDGAVR
jgi:PAS domain S-box-containing protein